MLPDFNRLRVFFHVKREGSVSAAARELHVTQSAVSQSLAKLEDELGVQLFVRRHRALVPTPAGLRLDAIVAPFVAELQGGLQAIDRERHELFGVLRIGAPVVFGSHRLPPILAEFRRRHPGVGFAVSLGHPSVILPQLEAGQLDLAFADVYDDRVAARAGLDVQPLLDEALILVGAPVYEASVLRGQATFKRLATADFIAYHPSAPAVHGWFRHHFQKSPANLRIAVSVESVQAVAAAAEAGMGFALVPAHAAEPAIARGALVSVRTRRRPITNAVSLVRVLDKVPSRTERAFVRHLRVELR